MGGKVQKQYLELLGHPILYYSLAAFQDSPLIDSMLLVTGAAEIPYVQQEIVGKIPFQQGEGCSGRRRGALRLCLEGTAGAGK